MLLAILLAATTPYLEMSGGPGFVHQSGRSGLGSSSLLRLNLGTPVTDRLDAEMWLSGVVDRPPLGGLGDRLVLGGGASGRLLVSHFGEERRFGLWLHGGAGLGVAAGGEGTPGPMGYAGALVS